MRTSFLSSMWLRSAQTLIRKAMVAIVAVTVLLAASLALPQAASAYPYYAQEAYKNPREATGRIVCANCHLGAKPTEVEVPQSVLPDTVFEAVVKIPYDTSVQQVQGDGSKGPLNVGAVLMLPEGFKLAPDDRLTDEMKEKVGELYVQPYSDDQPNILVVGPIPGEQYREITFPILSPDPKSDKSIRFGKYSVHVGGNRGRGQINPTGEKSNNTVYNASATGQIAAISKTEEGGFKVTINAADGKTVDETIPPGPELLVAEGQEVKSGDALTSNPNVGGFGQVDKEIVLQSPNRIKGLLAFFAMCTFTQIILVLKKKQVERVQAAEMNF
ncbi:apocytochrome f [Phormidesmis priestleyi ULC007]|uniref:Cytochrome f n=2 Tax=Phormidesmis priestleyi TaxID=268141 RepID=A0A2T1DIK6_9CYAN|nr:apocytochrome f [Phormidesmis priestleyi]PSB20271.1 apocytochrome f [Phormidesmis priestleyi ULC007]PZO50140.1 MAG: apocytochrome f [Phormidesmis priestleyi]